MIEYQLTRAEYVSAQTRWRSHPGRERAFHIGLAADLILLILGIFAPWHLTHRLFPFAVIMFVALVVARWWLPPMAEKLIERTVARRPELLGPKHAEFRNDGIVFIAREKESKLPWWLVRAVEEDHDFIYLCCTGIVYPLPKRAFDASSRDEFFRYLPLRRRA